MVLLLECPRRRIHVWMKIFGFSMLWILIKKKFFSVKLITNCTFFILDFLHFHVALYYVLSLQTFWSTRNMLFLFFSANIPFRVPYIVIFQPTRIIFLNDIPKAINLQLFHQTAFPPPVCLSVRLSLYGNTKNVHSLVKCSIIAIKVLPTSRQKDTTFFAVGAVSLSLEGTSTTTIHKHRRRLQTHKLKLNKLCGASKEPNISHCVCVCEWM